MGCDRCIRTSRSRTCPRSSISPARTSIANDAMYVEPTELHRIDDGRILRYDLTLPPALTVRYAGEPRRGCGRRARRIAMCQVDAMHLESVSPGRSPVARRSRSSQPVADDRARAPVGRSRAARTHGEDRADRVRDVQPVLGARGRDRRALVGGARVGCVHRSDRESPRRRSQASHGDRRRLRTRAARHAATESTTSASSMSPSVA